MPVLEPHAERKAFFMLPKAELHLHLEGCLPPMLLVKLAENHGEVLDFEEAAGRYTVRSFPEFLELFKWATSYLRDPEDYALLTGLPFLDMSGRQFHYVEITLSVGVMLLRKQDVEANFSAISHTAEKAKRWGNVRVQWIFDAVRQFGPEKAMEVARLAARMKSAGVVAFGLGGDEESLPAKDFRKVFDYAASEGLHRVVHAGEMGGPQSVRDAIEILGAERIGHGISSLGDERLLDLLIERDIPLEICPESNLQTGALARFLGKERVRLSDHPLRHFISRGVPVTLGTDDPAMFHTSLEHCYRVAGTELGLSTAALITVAENGFRYAFVSDQERAAMQQAFRTEARRLGLL